MSTAQLSSAIHSLYIINKAGGLIYQKVTRTILTHSQLSHIYTLHNPHPVSFLVSHVSSLPLFPHPTARLCCQDFLTLPRLAGNDYLRLLSTFHSLHAIAARGIHITPTTPSTTQPTSDPSFPSLASLTRGIVSIDTRDFRLVCYPTYTGLKFVVVGGVAMVGVERVLASVYGLYGDYVLKNAWYEVEMPIRCEQFDVKVAALMQQYQLAVQQQALLQQQAVR